MAASEPSSEPGQQPPEAQPRTWRDRLRDSGTILLVVVVFLALIEVVCRLSPLNPLKDEAGDKRLGVLLLDPELHHRFVPNLNTVDASRSIPYPLITNSQGWCESYDITPDKPAGTYRLFYVGDSNTQGVVAPGKKMADIVEQRLNRRRWQGIDRIEVVNTGTSSYSPSLEYLLIRDHILPLDPDLVVLNVDMTDCVNDMVYGFTADHDPGTGELLRVVGGQDPRLKYKRMTPRGLVDLGAAQRFSVWLGERSAFYATLQGIFGNRGAVNADWQQMTSSDGDWLRLDWDDTVQKQVNHTLDLLAKTHDLLKRHGVRFAITSVPHYPQYTGEWSPRPHEALAAMARQHGIPFLNGYAALEPEVTGAPVGTYFWQEDPTHLNEAGNALWADRQLVFLDQHPDLLPSPRP